MEENPFRRYIVEFSIKKKEQKYLHLHFLIPSTGLLPELYESFNVTSFKELFPTQADVFAYLEEAFLYDWELLDFKDASISDLIEKEGLKEESSEVFSNDKVHSTIHYLSGFYMTDKAYHDITGRLARKPGTGEEMENLSKDVFKLMIREGKLQGKDLIGLCVGNSKIRAKCDDKLFKDLLRKEFKFENFGSNPFKTYMWMHQVKDSFADILSKFESMASLYFDLQFETQIRADFLYEILYQPLAKEHGNPSYLSFILDPEFLVNQEIYGPNVDPAITDLDDIYVLMKSAAIAFSGKRRNEFRYTNDSDLRELWFSIDEDRRSEMDIWIYEADEWWDTIIPALTEFQNSWDLPEEILTRYNDLLEEIVIKSKAKREFFELSRQDVDGILALHNLVLDGVLSITMSTRDLQKLILA